MANTFRRLIPILILTALASVFSYGSVSAQSIPAQGITLSPASTDISIDPGSSVNRTVDIINAGTESLNITLTSSPYHVVSESYDPKFTQLPGTVDASEWVTISQPNASVASNETRTISYTVSVPGATAPGGYYAVVFAETTANADRTGVVARSKVGNILYINVNGDVKAGGTLSGSQLPIFSFAGPLWIGTKISNTGGSHFITETTYRVADFNGNEVYKAEAERYILPQTERDISYEWTPRSLFGLFTVSRSATIAGKLTELPEHKIFVINPWFLLASTFVLGLLVGIPVERDRRRRRQKGK